MSNTVTIKGDNQKFTGRLILTNYGKMRTLQRIAEGVNFTCFNFTSIALGDKLNNTYTSKISELGNETLKFPISNENVFQYKNTVTIETNLDLEGEVIMQEIGLFETIENEEHLFAYASGFSMVKKASISYDLVVDLSLSLSFENEHYSKFDAVLDDSEYALAPSMNRMFISLTEAQMDLERCIEINARELSYNKAQAFMLEQQKVSNTLRNILLLGRYQKTISKLGIESMTDCFYYPSEKPVNYIIKNLKDETSDQYEDVNKNRYTLVSPLGEDKYFLDTQGNRYIYAEKDDKVGFYRTTGKFIELHQIENSIMEVAGDLQICNRDNIDLSKTASIVYTTTLNRLNTEDIIIGKINPNEDEYYFDFRVIYDKYREEYGLQFTIYSYDYEKAKSKKYTDERKLVGHYRIKYFPPSRDKVTITNNETMFSFVYNGSIDNPSILMYVNTKLANEDTDNFIVDNFNYMGPCKEFKDKCTLRNYSQTVATIDYKKPMYYLIPEVDNSSIVVFNRELTEPEIRYLALISKS